MTIQKDRSATFLLLDVTSQGHMHSAFSTSHPGSSSFLYRLFLSQMLAPCEAPPLRSTFVEVHGEHFLLLSYEVSLKSSHCLRCDGCFSSCCVAMDSGLVCPLTVSCLWLS